MNISSTLSDSFFNESSHLTSIHHNLHEPSMFSTTTKQFYHDYQYNLIPIPILNYPNYSTNTYNISDNHIPYHPSLSLIPAQEQMVSTIKIHINPFFRSHSLNQTNKSSSEIEQQHNSSSETEQQHNSSLSSRSRSRSRSPPIDRQVKISHKKRQERQRRKAQREKFIQEKELIFKRQSSLLFAKSKHQSPDRWEHKEEKLKRLYKQYSTEDTFKQWKPLLLKDCFELYQYGFDKYYGTSINN